jgi:hypothetical protein
MRPASNIAPDSFARFLTDYRENNPIGDLAADFRRVLQKSPELGSEYLTNRELLDYFQEQELPPTIKQALRSAWRAYRRARKSAK